MKDAESKTKTKRIRHAYPKREIFHRWVHSPEYAYSPEKRLTCKHNCLCVGDIGRTRTTEDIQEFWIGLSSRVIAVIDRDNKKAIISTKYSDFIWETKRAIPDDFTIFYCHAEIPYYNILYTTEQLYRTHLEYLIKRYCETFLCVFYNALNGALTLHCDIDLQDEHRYVKEIKDFVKKYRLKSYSWYKTPITNNVKLWLNYKSYKSYTITAPSAKQICNDTVFTRKQKDLLRKRYFYTKYCYGNGIPFKDVDKYYYEMFNEKEIKDYFDKKNLYWNPSEVNESTFNNWTNYVEKCIEINNNIHKKYIENNIAKSEENYKKALQEFNEKFDEKDCIDLWRKGNNFSDYFTYHRFIPPKRRSGVGKWVATKIYKSNYSFDNTQLKLYGNHVITSRYASVTLQSAIQGYKLLRRYIDKSVDTGLLSFEFNNVNIGIYNLRDIMYVDKMSDLGEVYDFKSWRIRIGCHNLWLEEIEEFIRYYKLESAFGLRC